MDIYDKENIQDQHTACTMTTSTIHNQRKQEIRRPVLTSLPPKGNIPKGNIFLISEISQRYAHYVKSLAKKNASKTCFCAGVCESV
jgi:hypothetical protein